MTRSSVKVTDPQALGICREMRDLIDSLPKKQNEVVQKARKEWLEFESATNKILDENLERLRLALGLPKMDHPDFVFDFIDEHKLAFVIHGQLPPHVDKGGLLDILEKHLGAHHEH